MVLLRDVAHSLVFGSCVGALACAVGCGGINIGSSARETSESRSVESAARDTEDEATADVDPTSDDDSVPAPASTSTSTTPPPPPPPVPAGSFAAGFEILAISDVNVRAGEGTTFEVLATVPAGTRVKVQTTSGVSGWVNVTFNGKVGYVSKDLVSAAKYSAARGQQMAARALALWNGKPSRDLCLAGVDDTAESSGAIPANPGWVPRKPSAVDWQNFVIANPFELLARGYVRENLDVNHLPKGAIIGWRGGQCGYHAQYGHIEVVADDASSRACSDYCGAVKKNCGDPFVFVPIELN